MKTTLRPMRDESEPGYFFDPRTSVRVRITLLCDSCGAKALPPAVPFEIEEPGIVGVLLSPSGISATRAARIGREAPRPPGWTLLEPAGESPFATSCPSAKCLATLRARYPEAKVDFCSTTDEEMVWCGHRLREALRREHDIEVFTFCGAVGALALEPDPTLVAGPVTCAECLAAVARER